MVRISAGIPDDPKEEIDLRVENPKLDFEMAKDAARKKSRELHGETMLLSWHNAQTGEYYPTFDCGGSNQPTWILYAESRGANLTIRINDGAFTFMFLKLMPIHD